MAVSSIALSFAAGAIGLAVATTALAWRARAAQSKATSALQTQIDKKALLLGDVDAATGAFDEAYLAIEGDKVRLVWGEEASLRISRVPISRPCLNPVNPVALRF